MEKELTISELHEIYQKYGDLGFKVDTPYGYKDIEWCGITEENADVYRCELENGMFVEGADYHRLKKTNDEFAILKEIKVGEMIQTNNGDSAVASIKLLEEKDTLYDIQVAEVHQYYTNGIVSHNTTLTIDALKFLLHGNTTKTDRNEEIFNQFSNKNELTVKGLIELGGEELIIERKMKRSAKKGGGWTVTNKVNYYEILPDGEEKMKNEEDAIKTTAKLKATIGSEKDFEMLVLATEKNLDDLIGLTTTESSKVLTRLIGLEVIEMKEAVVRKMYNEFEKKKKANSYDVVTLQQEIFEHQETINIAKETKKEIEDKLEKSKQRLIDLNEEKEKLFNSKTSIDTSIISLNPSKLEESIARIVKDGKQLADNLAELKNTIDNFGDYSFDEVKLSQLRKEHTTTSSKISVKKHEIATKLDSIKDLIDGSICQACNRKLDDVDNTEHIEKHKKRVIELEKELANDEADLAELNKEINNLDEIRKKADEKNKLELKRDKIEVEIGSLRNDVTAKKNDLKKYKLNQQAIDQNKKIDAEIEIIKTNITSTTFEKESYFFKITKLDDEINANTENIQNKEKLIVQIKKEEEIEKIFKLYIELVGKKGISKLVLRSVLPIINAEVQRLLEDAADFEIEIFIDDKNDVQFLLNKDGVSKLLKSGSGFEKTASSLALRGVLGKISTLPMPNFITFDEVLGKVANENLEKLKPLFEKIKNMYEIVFLITHNDIVKDWGDNIVTVQKENNISKLTLK
jgi:DNA repair exonuclease SbcCD ATPase subunit